jgi:hypothetical protein
MTDQDPNVPTQTIFATGANDPANSGAGTGIVANPTYIITGPGGSTGGNNGTVIISTGNGGAGGGGYTLTASGQGLMWNGFQWVQFSLDPSAENAATPPQAKKDSSAGCTCKSCNDLYPQSEPNQDDGSFVCYGCRMTW